jgi:Ca-activated chloride channel family protein
MASTLSIVARDVKVQLEFNPGAIAEYRLIGYENRALAREDFRNDKVDAGEIGAGHSVTALYELTPVGAKGALAPGRYTRPAASSDAAHAGELGMLRLRYKAPAGGASKEIEVALMKKDLRDAAHASEDMRFAAAVAAFGQQLRGGKYLGSFGYREIESLAAGARGADRFGYRGEFLRLVRLASALGTPAPLAGCDDDCTGTR